MLNENIPMYLFHQGTNAKAYEYLGSHRDEEDENFTFFRVWAPHAVAVFVACDKNEPTAATVKPSGKPRNNVHRIIGRPSKVSFIFQPIGNDR